PRPVARALQRVRSARPPDPDPGRRPAHVSAHARHPLLPRGPRLVCVGQVMTGSERGAPVRALVFDVFGTLVDWRSGIAEAFDASGLDGDPAELAGDWRKRYVPILAEVNGQQRPWGNFDELHFITLDDLLRER